MKRTPSPSLFQLSGRSHARRCAGTVGNAHTYPCLRITPHYASSFERNTFNVDLMQLQQLLRLPKSTLNVFFNFFCFHGWSIGACFLHLLREDHRSSLKVENFLPKGVSFYPSISPFIWGHMKAMPVNLSCQPTEKEGNHSKKKIFCLRRV